MKISVIEEAVAKIVLKQYESYQSKMQVHLLDAEDGPICMQGAVSTLYFFAEDLYMNFTIYSCLQEQTHQVLSARPLSNPNHSVQNVQLVEELESIFLTMSLHNPSQNLPCLWSYCTMHASVTT